MSDYLNQVAKESNTETLIKIIEENRPGVARVIAESNHADSVVLARLINHPSAMVRNLLARNKKTSTDILKVMLFDSEAAIRDSARYTLARLGRPAIEVKAQPVPAQKPIEEVVKEIKKEKHKPKKNKNRKGGNKKGK